MPTSAPSSTETDTRDARLTEALARFKLAADAEHDQRERELTALRFIDHDDQWPEEVRRARKGFQPGGGLPSVPARPCLTINKLRQPVIQTSNEARMARLSLSFSPKGGGASRAIAEAYEDIARAIQADSRASVARQWAYDRAIKAGRGAYRVLTEYATDGDFDQDIVYKRILNQSSVYLDPAAQEPDWSDGEWAFIIEDIRWDRYQRAFPDSKLTKHGGDDPGVLTSIGDEQPEWVTTTESGGKVVRVAEYFYLDYTRTTVYAWLFPDGSERALAKDDPAIADSGAIPVEDETGQQPSRVVRERSVKWCKLTAYEILEEGEWPGRYIPIVPVIADESNINGERRWTGIVEPAMDAQRSYNVMRSAQVEGVGLAPRAPWVGYAETVEGYETMWEQSNVRNFPILYVKKVNDGTGGTLPPPQRSVVEPAIQAITLAAHEADADIKATTGRFDPSLGNLSSGERSGRAIQALQKQAEMGSSGYLDNLAHLSMVYEGKILRDLIPRIYSRPGRIVAAVGADDQRRSLLIGVPFVKGKDGEPQPVPPGTPGAITLTLDQGEYAVAVSVGKSYTTKREETVAMMGQLAEAAPQMVPIYADLWVGSMDFPGAKQIEDRLKKALPPQFQEQEGQPPVPPQVQQQMAQAQQMIEALSKELDAKNQLIETDAAKASADLEKTRMDIDSKERIAALQSQTQIELEKLKLQGAQMQAELQAQIQVEQTRLEQLQAYNTQLMAQDHEAGMAAQQAEQQRVAQAEQAGYQQDAQAQGAGFAQQASAQDAIQKEGLASLQAALQPTPTPSGGEP